MSDVLLLLTKGDKLIPWYFVIFFVVIAIVDGVMVTMAIKTNTGLVTSHPYEKGLQYNKIIESSEEQDALGIKSNINLENGYLYFSLNQNGKNISASKVTAHVTRPVQGGMDFKVELSPSVKDKNKYQAKINFPVKGLWQIRIFADIEADNKYQKSQRFVIK